MGRNTLAARRVSHPASRGAICLRGQGYEISRISDIFGVDRDSVSSWIDRFNQGGADALEDADHPGPPPMLDEQEQEVLKRLFKKHPNRPAKILEELERETGKKMSKWTLPNYAKQAGVIG